MHYYITAWILPADSSTRIEQHRTVKNEFDSSLHSLYVLAIFNIFVSINSYASHDILTSRKRSKNIQNDFTDIFYKIATLYFLYFTSKGANMRGYLPASIFKLCNKDCLLNDDGAYEECIISNCPHGLGECMKNIEKAMHPFLTKNKLSLNPAFLIRGNKGVGKNAIIDALAAKLGVHVYRVDSSDIQTATHAQTESKLRNVFMKSKLTAPCFLVLNNFEIYGKDNEGNYDPRLISFFQSELYSLFDNNNFPIILMCLSNSKDLASDLSRTFLETFTIDTPNQAQRTSLLRWLARSKNLSSQVDLEDIGAKTHGFMMGDLDALLYHAMKHWYLEFGADNGKICLRSTDLEKALDLMQKAYTTSLGAPKVPKVLWSDVGGLHGLKQEIMRTINLPLQHPNLLKITGLKRSGILLFGPPGTGKTLIAKAVATECGLCFLSVKGPELLNMYVGQSEQNVRQVFQRAREASPCIIFFDELDSLAPNRGISGDSGGVMDRVVSQLLSEMDGLNDNGTVFIIGATNRPDLLDPALLRPGRFDKLLYVGPCTEMESKVGVLNALTRKFTRASDVNLDQVATVCPPHVTGADLYSVCANAWFTAVRRTIENIENGTISDENLSPKLVKVTMEDFMSAAKDMKPSLSEEDLKYFQMLKQGDVTAKQQKEKHK
ncbi:Peroxin 6 [Carabus blaptoides fortunei]